jgi:hypothetical protein
MRLTSLDLSPATAHGATSDFYLSHHTVPRYLVTAALSLLWIFLRAAPAHDIRPLSLERKSSRSHLLAVSYAGRCKFFSLPHVFLPWHAALSAPSPSQHLQLLPMAGARPNAKLGFAISQRAATRSPAPTRVLLCSPRPCELPLSAMDAGELIPWCHDLVVEFQACFFPAAQLHRRPSRARAQPSF